VKSNQRPKKNFDHHKAWRIIAQEHLEWLQWSLAGGRKKRLLHIVMNEHVFYSGVLLFCRQTFILFFYSQFQNIIYSSKTASVTATLHLCAAPVWKWQKRWEGHLFFFPDKRTVFPCWDVAADCQSCRQRCSEVLRSQRSYSAHASQTACRDKHQHKQVMDSEVRWCWMINGWKINDWF